MLTDHWWWRPGWRPGRRCLAWHLTFAGAEELHNLVQRCQARLALPGLDLVPTRWLHLTMHGLGFADVVAEDELRRIIAVTRDRCARLPAFSLTFGPPVVMSEGVTLGVTPEEPLRALHTCLRDAANAARGEPPAGPDEEFWPHVSVAYSNQVSPAGPIRDQLAALGDARATVRISAVSLIKLGRDTHAYTWDARDTAPLG